MWLDTQDTPDKKRDSSKGGEGIGVTGAATTATASNETNGGKSIALQNHEGIHEQEAPSPKVSVDPPMEEAVVVGDKNSSSIDVPPSPVNEPAEKDGATTPATPQHGGTPTKKEDSVGSGAPKTPVKVVCSGNSPASSSGSGRRSPPKSPHGMGKGMVF